jgi:hypothetical protein
MDYNDIRPYTATHDDAYPLNEFIGQTEAISKIKNRLSIFMFNKLQNIAGGIPDIPNLNTMFVYEPGTNAEELALTLAGEIMRIRADQTQDAPINAIDAKYLLGTEAGDTEMRVNAAMNLGGILIINNLGEAFVSEEQTTALLNIIAGHAKPKYDGQPIIICTLSNVAAKEIEKYYAYFTKPFVQPIVLSPPPPQSKY